MKRYTYERSSDNKLYLIYDTKTSNSNAIARVRTHDFSFLTKALDLLNDEDEEKWLEYKSKSQKKT